MSLLENLPSPPQSHGADAYKMGLRAHANDECAGPRRNAVDSRVSWSGPFDLSQARDGTSDVIKIRRAVATERPSESVHCVADQVHAKPADVTAVLRFALPHSAHASP